MCFNRVTAADIDCAGESLTFGVGREKKKPLREFSRRGSGPVGVGVIFERGSVVWLGLFLRLTFATLGAISALGTTAGTSRATLAAGATLAAFTPIATLWAFLILVLLGGDTQCAHSAQYGRREGD